MASDHDVERVRRAYVATHTRLWRSVLAFAGSTDIADEAVAEAFAQALRRGDAIADVERWVWRAAFAIARGELAGRRRFTDGGSDVGRSMPEPALDLIRALRTLSLADRELLVLCHVGGWTPSELAAIAGIAPSTVRVRLHRANRRARRLFTEEDLA